MRAANGERYYSAMVEQGQGSSNFVAQIDLVRTNYIGMTSAPSRAASSDWR